MKWTGCLALVALLVCQFWATGEANQLAITVDNELVKLYIDGQLTGQITDTNARDWTRTTYYQIPDTFSTFAVYGTDRGVIAGMVFSDDNGFLSDGQFKCVKEYDPNWYKPGFDDSNWPNATAHSMHGDGPWYTRPGISSNAMWIWTKNYENPIDTNAYCRWTSIPNNPYCHCHGHADPLVLQFDGMSVAVMQVSNYRFAKSVTGCIYDSLISTSPPPEISADNGVLIINKFRFIVDAAAGVHVEFNQANDAVLGGAPVSGSSASNGGIALEKVADGWNMTYCDVTVLWRVGTREFLVQPSDSDRFVSGNAADAKDRNILDGAYDFASIDTNNPSTKYIRLTYVHIYAGRASSIKLGVFESINGNAILVKSLTTVNIPSVGYNKIKVSQLNIRADAGQMIGFVQLADGTQPIKYNLPSTTGYTWSWTPSGSDPTVNSVYSLTEGSRDYSFVWDYEVLGTMTTITTTSVTLKTPRQYGGGLSGLCGNCDRTQNDMETDGNGQPITEPGAMGMMRFINSYEVTSL